jgi:L-ascorbate metabolism protein UlaG (beta-lactamase superfamily)
MQHAASPISITWVGHATVLIEVDGLRIVTDPAITPRMAHLRRRVAVPRLPDVDAIAISHVHLDHLHGASLRRTTGSGSLVVPRGARSLVASLPRREVHEVVSGDVVTLRDGHDTLPAVRLRAVPANHSSGRGPHSRVSAAPVGYVVEIGERRVYFAGDTDLFDEMNELGPIDVALLPIWGWGPTLGDRHLDPPRAATATAWIDPVAVVPIHWGTYSPIRPRPGSPRWLENPLAAFEAALAELGLEQRLTVLRPGESMQLT